MSYITVTKDNFNETVLNNKKPVLLDFWASWCGPCRMVAPIVEEIAEERDDITVGKVNVDEQGELAKQFGIMSIPTLIVFKEGKIAKQALGYMPKEKILALLD
ncbi:MAG: thioredoxin [Clostridia bacterium]|nr:thioredoxin [Clostridia bacterium]